VWWRDPTGRWVIFSDVPPSLSCPRYFGRALERSETTPIDLSWTGPRSLRVTIPTVLEWQIQLGSTFASRILSRVGASAPQLLWRNSVALACVGMLAGPLLQSGKIRLAGAVPNGQHFQANPRVCWMVDNSRARIMDHDAGPTGPLEHQPRLADFWLPQRGIFFVGEARYRVVQHRSARVNPRSEACASTT
jgi:hypothetical protein